MSLSNYKDDNTRFMNNSRCFNKLTKNIKEVYNLTDNAEKETKKTWNRRFISTHGTITGSTSKWTVTVDKHENYKTFNSNHKNDYVNKSPVHKIASDLRINYLNFKKKFYYSLDKSKIADKASKTHHQLGNFNKSNFEFIRKKNLTGENFSRLKLKENKAIYEQNTNPIMRNSPLENLFKSPTTLINKNVRNPAERNSYKKHLKGRLLKLISDSIILKTEEMESYKNKKNQFPTTTRSNYLKKYRQEKKLGIITQKNTELFVRDIPISSRAEDLYLTPNELLIKYFTEDELKIIKSDPIYFHLNKGPLRDVNLLKNKTLLEILEEEEAENQRRFQTKNLGLESHKTSNSSDLFDGQDDCTSINKENIYSVEYLEENPKLVNKIPARMDTYTSSLDNEISEIRKEGDNKNNNYNKNIDMSKNTRNHFLKKGYKPVENILLNKIGLGLNENLKKNLLNRNHSSENFKRESISNSNDFINIPINNVDSYNNQKNDRILKRKIEKKLDNNKSPNKNNTKDERQIPYINNENEIKELFIKKLTSNLNSFKNSKDSKNFEKKLTFDDNPLFKRFTINQQDSKIDLKDFKYDDIYDVIRRVSKLNKLKLEEDARWTDNYINKIKENYLSPNKKH